MLYFNIFSVVAGLLPKAFTVTERGKVTVKGKGEMVTFWVDSKANRVPPSREEVSQFLVAKLLYNSLCLSASMSARLWGIYDSKMIDHKLIFIK